MISWSTGDENSGEVWVSGNETKSPCSRSHNEVLLPPIGSRQGLLMNSAFYDWDYAGLLGKIVVTTATD